MAAGVGLSCDHRCIVFNQWSFGQSRTEPGGPGQTAITPRFRAERPELTFLYEEIASLDPPLPERLGETLQSLRPDLGDLGRIGVPVLWLVGTEDSLTPPAAMREAHQLTPGSQYQEVAGTGRSVYFEQADRFNERVRDFLAASGWIS